MFKRENCENELAQLMNQKLIENKMEKKASFNKLSQAIDLLHSAAGIFDDTGFTEEAEVLTQLIEHFANKK